MRHIRHRLERGAYFDSIVLMQLQTALANEPGIEDCSASMATEANLAILESSGLLPDDLEACRGDDLLIVVAAEDESAATSALEAVDAHLARGPTAADGGAGLDDEMPPPASLRQARRRLPAANWAAISVPGRWAARVARQALDEELDVFLYSDNVAVDDEVALKSAAAARGRLVLGPDCGTTILGGIGFGFANHVRRGRVGLVGASGTGLQSISSRIHARGGGISHAIGVGGRDLSAAVGGASSLRALAVLAADPDTAAIVVVSKPPAGAVMRRLVRAALQVPKPVVLSFLGTAPPVPEVGNLRFASGLEAAADLAIESARTPMRRLADDVSPSTGFLRALFAGGTLALETLCQLRFFLTLSANLDLDGVDRLGDGATSRGHTVIDMGDDALTVGRLHPMIDPELRLRRLAAEAADPDVAVLLLDVVLGEGSEADPAARLAPVIAEAREQRGDTLEIVVLVVGTDADPQDLGAQVERLAEAGARVFTRLGDALERVVARLASDPASRSEIADRTADTETESLASRMAAPAIVNVGLERFNESFARQGAPSVHVAWRPPAGGDARLVTLLDALTPSEDA